MSLWNPFVVALLRSPGHRLLSSTTVALRYTGVRSGQQFTLPARYASNDDDIVIMVGRPERKTWWRNFRTGRDVEVLRAGQWGS